MTFRQYIDNPLGKGNAVFSQRDLFKELYTGKFDKILLREAGQIKYTLLYDNKKDEFYCHIKIPSEVVPNFYYDVIIQFYTDNNALRALSSLTDYNVRFFSNDPSFVYTYLRVFLKNDMFLTDLKERSPKLALKEDPKVKNPNEIIGYVKSLYFAYLYLKMKNLFNKHFYKMNGIPYDKKVLIANVEDAEIKISKRQDAENKIKKQETQSARPSEIKHVSHNDSQLPENLRVKRANVVKTVGTNSSHVKTTNKVKSVKKIK